VLVRLVKSATQFASSGALRFVRLAVTVRNAAAALAVGCAFSVAAQTPLPPSGAEDETPLGLPVVWHTTGRRLHDEISAWAVDAFSTDGKLVAIGDSTGVRIVRARDGVLVRKVWPGFNDETVYSIAVSKGGDVALGRVGKVEFHPADAQHESARYDCTGACGPVGSVAFSPDGTLLAFQGSRGLPDRRLGLGSVNVVNVRTGAAVAQLDASASRARVGFSSDGRRLLAASVTPFDDRERFGVRAWRIADWRVTSNVLGTNTIGRSHGALPGTEFAAAFERDGNLELRNLSTEAALWSVPLTQPALDAETNAGKIRLRLVEIAPNGRFVLSYEAPEASAVAGPPAGTIVIRNAADGAVEALYDERDVSALAIAPDSKTFVYTTGSGQTHTVLAWIPF
jgi:WD40 repeat protein